MDRIGQYHIEDRIGRGGMGEIYRAFDTEKRRHVAIKTIQSGMAQDDQAYRRFAREMKLASGLHHPAIVEVYEVLHFGGGACVVMELVDGFTVAEALRQGPLKLSDTLHIAHQVCAGLVEAHRNYIVHRDIKAENIMVSYRNEVKILDFGLARAVGGDFTEPKTLTRTGMIVGSVGSMAPEQILGEPVDPRTDLFSLGCLIYRLLTGQSPFHRRSFVHTLAAITSTPHRPLVRAVPSIPQAVSDLVDGLLAKLPENRPGDSEGVLQDLQELVRQQQPYTFEAAALLDGKQRASGVDPESSPQEATVDVSMILGVSPPPAFFAQPELQEFGVMGGEAREVEDAFERCQERLAREIEHLRQRRLLRRRWRFSFRVAAVVSALVALVALPWAPWAVPLAAVVIGSALGLIAAFGFEHQNERMERWLEVRQQRYDYTAQWLHVLRDVETIEDGWARSRRERQLVQAINRRLESVTPSP
jgi:serine/threonine-protein kinase